MSTRSLAKAGILFGVLCGLLSAGASAARAEKGNPFKKRASFQYYFDTRDYNTLEIWLHATPLPYDFALWGFTDLLGNQNDAAHRFDVRRSFSEYRLSYDLGEWARVPGMRIETEYDDFTPNGGADSVLRYGVTYKHPLPIPKFGPVGGTKGFLQWRVLPLESGGTGHRQLSLIYFVPFHKRVALTGFADYNLRPNAQNRWVVEAQLNLKLAERYWAVIEYINNDFEKAAAGLDGTGWAFGLRIDI